MSPTGDLVARLAARGIWLRRVGDQLGVTFADGTQTPEALTYLRDNKAKLLAALAPPTFPKWPRAALESAFAARVSTLKTWGHSVVEAERQAADEALSGGDHPPHEAERCDLHACPQRQTSYTELYRCPACAIGAFAGNRSAA